MKKSILTATIALMGIASAIQSQAAAIPGAPTVGNGDSFLYFRAIDGTGSDKNIQIDLGNLGTSYGNFNSFNLDFSSVGSIVSQTFGSNWASNNKIYWGIIGTDDSNLNLVRSTTPGITQSGLSGDLLAAVNNSADNMIVAGFQGNATQGTIFDNNGNSHYYSIYSTGNSGSATSMEAIGFTVFPGSISDPSASKSITLFGCQQVDPYAANEPVDLGTATVASGSVQVVPEPSTYALFTLGALMLVVVARRRFLTSSQS